MCVTAKNLQYFQDAVYLFKRMNRAYIDPHAKGQCRFSFRFTRAWWLPSHGFEFPSVKTLLSISDSSWSTGRAASKMTKYPTVPLQQDPLSVSYGSIDPAEKSVEKSHTKQWYTNLALINFAEFAAEGSRGVVLATQFASRRTGEVYRRFQLARAS